MAIGTSLGAYFEDEFHHQAGIDTPPEVVKPTDTPDDNERIVEGDMNQKAKTDKPQPISDTSTTPLVSSTMPLQAPTEPTGALKTDEGTETPERSLPGRIVDKLLGLNGQERHQLWPEKMLRDAMETVHNVSTGQIPMWGYDPESGEMHTSAEGIGAAVSVAPMAISGAGFPAVIHLKGEGLDALQEGPDAFQQFMATRGRNQPSNITPVTEPRIEGDRAIWEPQLPISPYEQVPFDGGSHILQGRHPDSLNDEEFYNYGQYHSYGSLTPAQNTRWDTLDRAYAQQHPEYTPEGERTYTGTEADLVDHDTYEHAQQYVSRQQQRIAETKALVDNAPDKATRGNITIAKDSELENISYGNRHHYNFLSEGGQPGELTLTERQNGRELHVNWIGAIGKPGPMDVGKSEMKNLFFLLADRYPNAEKITGFRVSGARAAQGRIGDAEMRIPGRRAKPVNQEYGDDPDLLTRGQ